MNSLSKQLLKCTLLLLISFSLINCEKEEPDTDSQNKEELIDNSRINSFKIISQREIENSEITKRIEAFQKKSVGARDAGQEIIIDTESIKHIVFDDNHESFTYIITNSENNNIIENLVITDRPDGTIETIFVEHILDQPFTNLNINNLHNHVVETKFTYVDDATTISNSSARVTCTYSCTTVWTLETSDLCEGEVLGDECYDENGPIQVEEAVVLAEACGTSCTSGGGGSGGGSTGDSSGDSIGGGGSLFMGLNFDYAGNLINMLGIDPFADLERHNWIRDTNNKTKVRDLHDFLHGNYSSETINISLQVLNTLMSNTNIETFEEALLSNGYFTIDFTGTNKVDPAEELNCFDLTQGAKLIVYVQQPRENSDTVVGPNEVGHAFIGIEQGGIVRQVGYYPDQEPGFMGVGDNFDAAIKTNYDYLYHVSISQDISSTQLTNIVNYTINFPETYNTNNYACADFAINIGNLGGMNLPSTTVSYLTFSGRSPGILGQEIRAMNSTSTTTISTTSTNSPSRQGTCPN